MNQTIKRIRTQAFLTQAEFAKAIGVSASAVGKWELGLFKPSLRQQAKIVAFCKEKGIEYKD